MFTRGKPSSDTAGCRILAVRLGAMGDIIHALPAVATLKHSFPHSHLSWLVEPRWAPLIEGNPFLDEIVPLDRRSLRGLLEARRRLRAARFDFAVDFQGLIKSAVAASLARPERIYGFHQSQVREKLAALFYSHRVRTASPHVVDRNLELAAAAGALSVVHAFPLPEGAREGLLPERGFVLASPLAGWKAKQWPLEYYSELARMLEEECHIPLVLNGPAQLEALFPSVPGVWLHCSSVAGLIHATRRALAVVGIDSGPLHLAAALQKPGVAIYGPTDPARNGPYGGTIKVLRSARAVTTYKRRSEISPAMREVTPAMVMAALKQVLSSRAGGACPD